MQPLAVQFQRYLAKQNLSAATRKNYVSDVGLFLAVLSRELQEDTIQPAHLNQRVFADYGRSLVGSPDGGQVQSPDGTAAVNPATAQRHLASLKRFGKWLAQSGRNDADPAAVLNSLRIDPTVERLVRDFKNELVRQKLSTSTVKNYVSDVNNYLLWAVQHVKLTDNNSIKL